MRYQRFIVAKGKVILMETFYLVDFENVHNGGITNIESLSKDDYVYIFSTQNATDIDNKYFWLKNIERYLVPVRKQSLDMHLVSYLGYLLATYGKQCSYVIVSNDKDYDNIISFWKEEGYPNISRKSAIPGKVNAQNETSTKTTNSKTASNTQTVNNKINAGMDYEFTGEDRSELNQFMQHGLVAAGYDRNTSNIICKYVVAHCNDERILSGIHNDLKREWPDGDECSVVYKDVKSILEKFVASKSKVAKRESQVRSFFGQHFKEKIYVDCKEEIITIILHAKTRQQVNNELLKLYSDGNVVKHIYQIVQPLIKELPGK